MVTGIMKILVVALIGVAANGTIYIAALDVDGPNSSATRKAAGRNTAAGLPDPVAPTTPARPSTANLTWFDRRATPSGMPAPPLPQLGASSGEQPLRIGDKLRIAVYEHLELDEEKWGRAHPPRPALQQRMDLSGEYVVDDDGTISLPLIGSISVVTRDNRELERELTTSLESLTGRESFVTVLATEHQPIYVLGPVKNPGAYKYAPGMTVLHAIALAGGLDRVVVEPWQRIEAVRESERRWGAGTRTMQLLARLAVLKAERDHVAVEVPPRLFEIADEDRAKTLIREQIDERKAIVLERRSQESAATAAVDNARSEVDTLSGRVRPFEESIRLRTARVDSMRTLAADKVVASSVLIQAQGELADVQERREDAIIAITLAKQRLTLAEEEKSRQQTQASAEIEREIISTEQEIADGERDIASSESVLKAIRTGSLGLAPATESDVAYEIVRQRTQGATKLASTGTTSLQPGDLVHVLAGNAIKIGASEAVH